MLIDFFYTLRSARLPVSVKEYLTLLEALKAGVLDAKFLSKSEIEALSKLPSLDGIRARLLSLLTQPAASFVRVLDAEAKKEAPAA